MLRLPVVALCIFILPTACMKTESKEISAMREIAALEKAGKCEEAVAVTSTKLSGGARLFGLGSIAYNCEGNPDKGLKYLNSAADSNYEPALKQLIAMDSATSAQKKQYSTIQQQKRKQAEAKRIRSRELQEALVGMGGCGSLSCMAKGATETPTSAVKPLESTTTSGVVFKHGQIKNSQGETLCIYKNRTIINNGYNSICPVTINGETAALAAKPQGTASNRGVVFKSGQIKNARGQTLCTYKNGTTINNRYNSICPMSISSGF
jgi:hypothetical protein